MMSGTLLEESENFELDLIQASFTPQASTYGFGFFDKAKVTLPGAAGLAINDSGNFHIDTILVTNKWTSWNKQGKFDLKVDKVVFDSLKEIKKSLPVAMALSRNISGKEQKIMVLGDADFMSNAEVSRFTPNNVNSSFVIRMFKWFSDGQYPVSAKREESIDTQITVTRSQVNWQKGFFLGLVPLTLTLFGSIILIRRKRN